MTSMQRPALDWRTTNNVAIFTPEIEATRSGMDPTLKHSL